MGGGHEIFKKQNKDNAPVQPLELNMEQHDLLADSMHGDFWEQLLDIDLMEQTEQLEKRRKEQEREQRQRHREQQPQEMDIFEQAYHKTFKNKNDKILAEAYKADIKFQKQLQKEALEEQKRRREEAEAEQRRVQREAEQAERARLNAEREKVRLRNKALRADRRKVFTDKVRHGFYGFIKGFVDFGRWLSGASAEARNSTETSVRETNLAQAYRNLERLSNEYRDQGREEEFNEKFGANMSFLAEKMADTHMALRKQYPGETEGQIEQRLSRVTFDMSFGENQVAHVVGGTKPSSIQYAQDGSRWLVKESRSCIGVDEPNAAIVTEAGYKVQKLVNPDTAIEAFKGVSAGLGTVSYQRMVKNVVTDHVDLFQFSRTPESMTEEELGRVEALAPQLLREHTTDWLLYNFDTKGENFILSRNPDNSLKLYGIDKEAGFRAILDEGAQKMSKDYQKFDQDTVYNQLFRHYAAGSMDFDLQTVETQIRRVEAMSDDDYMAIFSGYIEQQRQTRPDDVPEIERRIKLRKQNLRAEYREFFGNLVRERMKNVSPEDAEALNQKYFHGNAEGLFLFEGDTAETIQREREKKMQDRVANREELQRKAEEADRQDERSYKRRHALYDFSKGFVMGLKKLKPTGGIQEQRTTQVSAQTLKRRDESTVVDENNMATLTMESDHEIFLGGTKPMSEYVASDGSLWLAKQAVNCMGYYKIEGALLTEAGANLQKIIDPATAVDAFVGRTRKHGDVSFQRRLEHVEGGLGKLDLFKFSKHPELATAETIQAVQELSPQILREHTTDWLLCNFDTKGENFIITKEGDGPRVLHGIDKEAAFNKILKPEAQHMSRTYQPHANNTLYNVVFSMYANAEMDLDLFDVLPQIERMEQMDHRAYMETFRGYLDHMEEKVSEEEFDAIRENIMHRKTNLRQEYEDFFTTLVNERCTKLHPDEAVALKNRYFGPGGNHFRFPRG